MKRIILMLVLSFLSFGVNAALVDRGEGFIYDDVLDITWKQDAVHDQQTSWNNQVAWAAGYSKTHSVYGVFNDWRLPTTLQPDATCNTQNGGIAPDYGCIGSEMGHLFHVDGISTSQPGPFNYVLPNFSYWSGTAIDDFYPMNAWLFDFSTGGQVVLPMQTDGYAWAVHDGDIAASVVPIPAAVWLFGSGLGLLGWVRRKVN